MTPEHLQQLETLPARLEALVSGANDRQLDTPYRDGGWTVRQVIHHLADSHMNGFIRMRLLLTEEHPSLKPYPQDKWAELADSSLPPEHSLTILKQLHHRWTVMLRALPAEAFERTGFHPEIGEVTLRSLLENYATHGETHLGHIRQGLARS